MDQYYLYGLTLIVAMIGYFLTSLSSDLKEIQKDHNACKERLPHDYVLKEDYHAEVMQLRADFKDDLSDIKQLLGKVFDKIDKLEDKK